MTMIIIIITNMDRKVHFARHANPEVEVHVSCALEDHERLRVFVPGGTRYFDAASGTLRVKVPANTTRMGIMRIAAVKMDGGYYRGAATGVGSVMVHGDDEQEITLLDPSSGYRQVGHARVTISGTQGGMEETSGGKALSRASGHTGSGAAMLRDPRNTEILRNPRKTEILREPRKTEMHRASGHAGAGAGKAELVDGKPTNIQTAIMTMYATWRDWSPTPDAPILELYHVPVYAGVDDRLPSYAYCIMGGQVDSREFVEQRMRVAAAMNGWEADQVMDALSAYLRTGMVGRDTNKALDITADALCFTATSFDYVSDRDDRGKITERMQIARAGLYADDCEGVGKENELCTRWRQLEVSRADYIYPVVEVLRRYATLMVTAAATSPSMKRASEPEDGKTDANYICHIYTLLVPLDDVMDMIDGRHGGKRSPLPALILEGTNYNSSCYLGAKTYGWDSPEDMREQAMHVAQRYRLESSSRFFKKADYRMYPQKFFKVPNNDVEMGPFYRWVVECWASVPGYTAMHYLFSKSPETREYGMPLCSLLKREAGVHMVPVALPKAIERAAMDDVYDHLLNEAPVPHFEAGEGHDATLEQIMEIMECPPRDYVASRAEPKPIYTPFIDYRFKRIEHMEGIMDAIRATRPLRYEWSYFPLVKGDEIYCIQVRLFMEQTKEDERRVRLIMDQL